MLNAFVTVVLTNNWILTSAINVKQAVAYKIVTYNENMYIWTNSPWQPITHEDRMLEGNEKKEREIAHVLFKVSNSEDINYVIY